MYKDCYFRKDLELGKNMKLNIITLLANISIWDVSGGTRRGHSWAVNSSRPPISLRDQLNKSRNTDAFETYMVRIYMYKNVASGG